MTKLKSAEARRITSDWAELFPEMSVWKPLRLLRRIGPVLQGISLERSSSGDQYYPTAHVHSLVQDFPVISISLAHYLNKPASMKEAVDVSRHADQYRAAASRLEERSTLPLRRRPELGEIVHAYRDFAAAVQQGRLPAGIEELEDSILVPAAAGDRALAEESLSRVSEVAQRWSRSEAPMGWTDTQEWLDSLRARADDPARLMAVVDEQIALHKLEKVRTD
ncbi:hypothetical protein HRW23_14795 [Streptomyces lunaelactis]|uniref:hypothetical protein n=1 Tax=Streptomyces lunaelactis TaxID=1535768 RepID=UPI0015854422|nr:hypothetical protein [Streptomyces lunaelactis]NUK01580.1 hypothetical protein [Streptomyces lunaelactis]NUK10470.1 hypothetical protein [Streptomyces lunaelactis]NUK16874.1 hypothetical protein [Streptomyces lunaelactis]NUK36767.1 hypothetical protein [Streptomyces lunaelactis]NUK44711.1 hypothetical protein [Streptomyces lunaelactis]